jgi:SanA protein
LLGASKKTSRGNDNLYFKYRIEAASKLYKAGKIKHIIVSGDNHIKEYDEATDMCDALIIEEYLIVVSHSTMLDLEHLIRWFVA